ncbi:MAG TPA: hypothetical protein VFH08_00645 [Chitinophagaceae bacterium]|nr:hypothetical protein [Chitinophagaceae bacterium]
MKQNDTFILKEDLNPEIKAGMTGVILEIYSKDDIEIEFVKQDGTNYEHNGQPTFTIKKNIIEIIS